MSRNLRLLFALVLVGGLLGYRHFRDQPAHATRAGARAATPAR